jgi:hypothetical protein
MIRKVTPGIVLLAEISDLTLFTKPRNISFIQSMSSHFYYGNHEKMN